MSRRPLPSLKGLQAFEAFARTGSMTRAAEELHVTHGAVSRQVKALELQLGAGLVTGPRHRLALTAAGRQLAASLSAAFDMAAAGLPGADAGQELVVSCLGTFAMKWLIPRLPRFLHDHPGVRVRIVEDQAPADFSQGGVHAAIRLQLEPAPPGLKALAFLDHAYGPVLSPALFDEAQRDGDRVLRLPRLHSETFSSGWAQWAGDTGTVLPPAPVEQAFEHNSYLLEAAAAGMGVAVTAWAFARADIEGGRLTAPWGFHPLPSRFTYLRPALADNPAAEAFGAWLRSEGRRDPPAPTQTIIGNRGIGGRPP
jgi:LysR family glycine cleavage system transcriptional activator